MAETALARLLHESGRSRTWLARRLTIDPSSVSRWATGRRQIPRRYLAEIAQLLDPSVTELEP